MNEAALTPQKAFEEKIKDRLREQIGDLIPDEVLQKMTEQATEDMFFKRVQEKDNYGRDIGSPKPSWFENEAAVLLKVRIDKKVEEFINKNESKIEGALLETIKEKLPELIASYFVTVLTNKASTAGANTGMSFQSIILEKLQRHNIY